MVGSDAIDCGGGCRVPRWFRILIEQFSQ